MTIKAFGKAFGLSERDIWTKLIEYGYLTKDGDPKSKYKKLGYFDDDYNVIDIKSLSKEFAEYLEEDNENDIDENLYTFDDLLDSLDCTEAELVQILMKSGYYDDKETWTRKARTELLNDDDLITVKGKQIITEIVERNVEKLSAKVEDISETYDLDALKNTLNSFVFESKSDISMIVKELIDRLVNFSHESERLVNKPGTYKGWTISNANGGIVYAKKGSKKLKTTIKGNIRSLISKEDHNYDE